MWGIEGKRRANKIPGYCLSSYKDSRLEVAMPQDGPGSEGEGRKLDPSAD